MTQNVLILAVTIGFGNELKAIKYPFEYKKLFITKSIDTAKRILLLEISQGILNFINYFIIIAIISFVRYLN